jgi:hypothetical protein
MCESTFSSAIHRLDAVKLTEMPVLNAVLRLDYSPPAVAVVNTDPSAAQLLPNSAVLAAGFLQAASAIRNFGQRRPADRRLRPNGCFQGRSGRLRRRSSLEGH